ncbi:MAG: PhzF family phenazine biosynthesis protein [Bacillota bacterium]
MKEIDIFQVDAFTDKVFGGNPAGVVPDAAGLTEDQMKPIAREMNCSETAFVTAPSEAGTGRKPAPDLRVRFFTPTDEVDLCGHATIGTFFFLAAEGRLPGGRPVPRLAEAAGGGVDVEVVVQETKAGDLPVYIYRRGLAVERVMMAQASPRILDEYDGARLAELAALLGADPADLTAESPTGHAAVAQVVTTGLPDLILPVRDLERLRALRPNSAGLGEWCRERGLISVHAFCFGGLEAGTTVHGRDFAPSVGIPEESATGTANGALGAYLVLNRLIPLSATTMIRAEQGHILRRPSQILVEIEVDPATLEGSGRPEVREVRVGGRARAVLRGKMALD